MVNIQSNFTSGELAPSLVARMDLIQFQNGAKEINNMFVHVHGGVSNRPGTKFVCEISASNIQVNTNVTPKVRLIPFSFSDQQTYVLQFSDKEIFIYNLEGKVNYDRSNSSKHKGLDTPYSAEDIHQIKYIQSADVLYLVHPGIQPHILSRTTSTWQLNIIKFTSNITPPTINTNNSSSSSKEQYKITALSNNGFYESLPSEVIHQSLNQKIEWASVENADLYAVYKNKNGIFGFIGYTTDEKNLSFIDDGIMPDTTHAPPQLRNPFENNNNPSTITFHEQRLIFASSTTSPQTVWMSRSGSYHNMNVSMPSQDDDSITFTIASRQVNAIEHLVSLKDLIILTSAGIWKTTSTDYGPITPTSLRIQQYKYGHGAANIPPIIIGNSVIYICNGGSRIYELSHSEQGDNYIIIDLTLLSTHLFEGYKIVDWTYARDPHSIIWCVRDDGILLGLTYLQEHKVYAWHQHSTEGKFLAVTSIKEGQEDAVYFVVERQIDSQPKYFIEKFESRSFQKKSDGVFLDCHMKYTGEERNKFTNIDYLSGTKFKVIMNGNSNTNGHYKIEGNYLTTTHPVTSLNIGLPYSSCLIPLAFEGNISNNLTRQRQIPRIRIFLLNCDQVCAGPNKQQQTALKSYKPFKGNSPPIETPTKIIDLNIPPQWGIEGGLVLSQDEAVPLTILAIIPEIKNSS